MKKLTQTECRNRLEAALNYADQGFPVFPLRPGEKTPLLSKKHGGNGCKDATTDQAQIEAWWSEEPSANIGIATGEEAGFFVLDVDLPDGPASLEAIEALNPGEDIQTVFVNTGGGGFQVYLKWPGFEVRNSAGKLGLGLDIRGTGGYVVAPPSIHPSGQPYVGEVWREDIAESPAWLLSFLKSGVERSEKKAKDSPLPRIPEGRRNDSLARMAGSLRRKGLDEEGIFEALAEHNAKVCDPPLHEEEVASIARNIASYSVGDGEAGPTGYDPFDLTDVGNANRFVEQFGENARYCTPMGEWLLWTGRRWMEDHSRRVVVWAKKVPAAIFHEAAVEPDPDVRKAIITHARRSQSAGKIRALIDLSAPELPVLPAELDRDKWLLNLRNGTMDLRTGELHPHERLDLLTKLAPVDFDPEASAPLWDDFVHTVMNGDEDLIAFLRRIVGYSLTGDISERCIFLLLGGGANGKSTFVETIQFLLGDYALATPVETLMVTRSGGIPNDIARLRGARMVATSEGEMGQRLAESLVKRLTGGDTITARFLHKEFFQFETQCKIIISTNHSPQIRGADNGVWDRIRMIPFDVRFSLAQQDKNLKERLKKELSGIFNWALTGCLEWQELGSLAPPQVVTDATEAYRREMDVLGAFLEEEANLAVGHRTSSADLYACFAKWVEKAGEGAMSRKMFGSLLHERGFKSVKSNGNHFWEGITLKRRV